MKRCTLKNLVSVCKKLLKIKSLEHISRYLWCHDGNTGGPRISWFFVPKDNHEMQGSWLPGTVFSVKWQEVSSSSDRHPVLCQRPNFHILSATTAQISDFFRTEFVSYFFILGHFSNVLLYTSFVLKQNIAEMS